jgi:hypothetical protein
MYENRNYDAHDNSSDDHTGNHFAGINDADETSGLFRCREIQRIKDYIAEYDRQPTGGAGQWEQRFRF